MRVHHLNCGTLCPLAAETFLVGRERMVCHCLLIETEDGLVLVDSGFGRADADGTRPRPFFLGILLRSKPELAETAHARIEALGLRPDDVRHVVMTHLDVDHAGGLSDFPSAKVHVMKREQQAALRPTLSRRHRYQRAHFAHGPDWETYEVTGEPWFGFEAVRALRGLPPEILLVPLPGHSPGHAGVAVDTGQGWLLHAGDAYFAAEELDARPRCPPGLALFQHILETEGRVRLENQVRLRALRAERGAEIQIFCAHDESELRLGHAPTAPRGDAPAR